jgi:three-Cys-motif partner protein
MAAEFHEKPYDEGTLAKLKIFELYTQAWIPVFLSQQTPPFPGGVHIFDFFCGPGTDSVGVSGSPLRIMEHVREYFRKPLAGWGRVPIVVHFHDAAAEKVKRLGATLEDAQWSIPGVTVDRRCLAFQDALRAHETVLQDPKITKLLLIDQFGVNKISDTVFKNLTKFPTTDFIFFLSSSTLHRFRKHPAIKQKIDEVEDTFEVHRAALNY